MNKSALFILLVHCTLFKDVENTSRNISLDIKNLVNNDGYPFERHHVETEDGYILELHRIPGNFQKIKNPKNEAEKDVVFLVTGFADTSATFLCSGPNLSLAYILADKGYDVWLSNPRGNLLSRKNKFYSSTNPKFWNFSWHEIGLYDNTASIDYILQMTKRKKLFHVCHSEGCAAFYVMVSLRPEYNKKIFLSINLAPAVFYTHPSLLMRTILTYFYLQKNTFANKGYKKVFDQNLMVKIAKNVFCKPKTILRMFCYFGTYTIQGFDWFQTDLDLFAKYLDYHPTGASSKELVHYAMSLFQSKSFSRFDYGKNMNMEMYNSTIPPKYPLDRVQVPVVIFYGDSDNIVSVKDVQQLLKIVPKVISSKLVKNYNHGAYFMQHSAKVKIHDEVLKFFQK